LTGEAAGEPEGFAVVERIGGELIRTGGDNLDGAAGGTVDERGGVAVDDVAGDFPGGFAGVGVDGEDVGVGVLVGDQDEFAIGVDGRGDDAVLAVEGAEGELPEGLAVEGVGEEAEVGEEDVDVFAVGGGGGGGAMVERVLGFAFGSLDTAAPEFTPGGLLEADGEQVVALRGGEEDAVADEDGRGLARREGCFPEHVLGRAEVSGEGRATRAEAGAIGAAELGPVGGGERKGEGEQKGSVHGDDFERVYTLCLQNPETRGREFQYSLKFIF